MKTVIKEAHKTTVKGLLVYLVEGEVLRWRIEQRADGSFVLRTQSIETGIKYRSLSKGVDRQRDIANFIAEVEEFIKGGD